MNQIDKYYDELSKYCKITKDVMLSSMTTLRIGGLAAFVAYPESILELDQLYKTCKKLNLPTKVIGKGSNLLCSDEKFNGVIIKLSQPLTEYYFDKEECVVQAGCSVVALSTSAMKNGLSGLEFASGIPASIGGAIFMNAGAYKSSMGDIVKQVMVYRDQKFEWIDSEECAFSYRKSIFQDNPEWIIVAAKLKLTYGDSKEIEELIRNRREKRMSTQPLNFPSAGSVFRNHDDIPAWKIIDELGYRGKSIGGAKVSEKHVNFIVNYNNSNAKDFLSLVESIQQDAKNKMNYDLKLEVEKFNW
ncbi:MAG: UDP-N-acetylmuramate dehydrogenase [Anaerorhabdus sp.]